MSVQTYIQNGLTTAMDVTKSLQKAELIIQWKDEASHLTAFEKDLDFRLPWLLSGLELSQFLLDSVMFLIEADDTGITTEEFREAGFNHPAQLIYRLRKLGAVIHTEHCRIAHTLDGPGRRMALYKFLGWRPAHLPNQVIISIPREVC